MKKIIIALALMIAGISANAGNVLDNAYVTVKGGATALTHPKYLGYEDWAHSIQSAVSLQLGTWVTESFGVAVDGTAGIDNGSKQGLFKTHTLFNYVDVSALAKYRVRFGTLDVVAAAGPSWIHGFAETLSNNIGTKFQVEFNVNLTDHLAVNIVPEFNYNFFGPFKYQPYFDSRQSWYGLLAGVTYKFGDKFNKANPDLKYTQADVDALNAEINKLRNQEPQVVEKIVEKIVTNNVVKQDVYEVAFEKGRYNLSERAKATLNTVPADATVIVEATASPEGNAEFNQELSQNRADAVADFLKQRGVTITSAKGLGVTGGDSQRIARVVLK